MDNRMISAQPGHLLALPAEIVSLIIDYIDGDIGSLANFALVSSDCRQFSRSRQFRSVVIDHREDRATAFVQAILKENGQHDRWNTPRYPSLTTCIRQISISTKDPSASQNHDSGKQPPAANVSRAHEPYLAIISLVDKMPNLEMLEFYGCRLVLHCLLENMRYTTVRAFKCQAQACCRGSSLSVDSNCISGDREPLQPLTRLDITLDSMLASAQYVQGQDYVFTNIFDDCAPTLQSLKLSHTFPLARLSLAADFSQLRTLHVVKGSLLDSRSCHSLFQGGHLSTLAVDISDEIMRDSLVEMSPHMKLEVLALHGIDSCPEASLLHILNNNTSLKSLYLGGGLSSELNEKIISILVALPRLRSLSMTWSGSEITTSSLVALATLRSLQQLHISAGQQHGTWHDWFINHEALLCHLSPLKSLERIVVTRDSYILDNGSALGSAGGYYIHRLPARGQWLKVVRNGLSNETVTGIWEGQHRYHLIDYSQKYTETFTNLKSIFIGQLTFDIVEDDRKRTAKLNNRQRCENFPVMESMFDII